MGKWRNLPGGNIRDPMPPEVALPFRNGISATGGGGGSGPLGTL